MTRPPNSSLLDRLVDLLGDTMSLRKAAALAMLAFVYLFVAKQWTSLRSCAVLLSSISS